ncbi:hypothetical protein RHMOL_Rhmol04G0248100 [Rhododendron molle]|uniref:Uncharacterized protein n=1 Tax=Rhododendron molle TaxID=49168 RepID=A0ACC0P3W6_RHOML|nr:hypothetical protein RHMOL_Rhmol04G0248100 [Rhododendron molle]
MMAAATAKSTTAVETNNSTMAPKSFGFSGFGCSQISNGSPVHSQMDVLHAALYENLRSRSQGKEFTDADILNWANKKVKITGRTSHMDSFKDKNLSNGLFFLELPSAVQPRVVNWNLVTKGESDEEKELNATYIISVARKLGCSIFLLPEDIMELKSPNHDHHYPLLMLASIYGEDKSSLSGEVSNLTMDDAASDTTVSSQVENEITSRASIRVLSLVQS